MTELQVENVLTALEFGDIDASTAVRRIMAMHTTAMLDPDRYREEIENELKPLPIGKPK